MQGLAIDVGASPFVETRAKYSILLLFSSIVDFSKFASPSNKREILGWMKWCRWWIQPVLTDIQQHPPAVHCSLVPYLRTMLVAFPLATTTSASVLSIACADAAVSLYLAGYLEHHEICLWLDALSLWNSSRRPLYAHGLGLIRLWLHEQYVRQQNDALLAKVAERQQLIVEFDSTDMGAPSSSNATAIPPSGSHLLKFCMEDPNYRKELFGTANDMFAGSLSIFAEQHPDEVKVQASICLYLVFERFLDEKKKLFVAENAQNWMMESSTAGNKDGKCEEEIKQYERWRRAIVRDVIQISWTREWARFLVSVWISHLVSVLKTPERKDVVSDKIGAMIDGISISSVEDLDEGSASILSALFIQALSVDPENKSFANRLSSMAQKSSVFLSCFISSCASMRDVVLPRDVLVCIRQQCSLQIISQDAVAWKRMLVGISFNIFSDAVQKQKKLTEAIVVLGVSEWDVLLDVISEHKTVSGLEEKEGVSLNPSMLMQSVTSTPESEGKKRWIVREVCAAFQHFVDTNEPQVDHCFVALVQKWNSRSRSDTLISVVAALASFMSAACTANVVELCVRILKQRMAVEHIVDQVDDQLFSVLAPLLVLKTIPLTLFADLLPALRLDLFSCLIKLTKDVRQHVRRVASEVLARSSDSSSLLEFLASLDPVVDWRLRLFLTCQILSTTPAILPQSHFESLIGERPMSDELAAAHFETISLYVVTVLQGFLEPEMMHALWTFPTAAGVCGRAVSLILSQRQKLSGSQQPVSLQNCLSLLHSIMLHVSACNDSTSSQSGSIERWLEVVFHLSFLISSLIPSDFESSIILDVMQWCLKTLRFQQQDGIRFQALKITGALASHIADEAVVESVQSIWTSLARNASPLGALAQQLLSAIITAS
eukprot:ANDGO_00903.mRNA.1 hypothetical protein